MSIDTITTQWVMTLFMGYIQDRDYILPIIDNFILEKNSSKVSSTPLASWRVVFGYMISILSSHVNFLKNSSDLAEVAIHFQQMQQTQDFGFANSYQFHKLGLQSAAKISLETLQELYKQYFENLARI
jgi:hypothetical protein